MTATPLAHLSRSPRWVIGGLCALAMLSVPGSVSANLGGGSPTPLEKAAAKRQQNFRKQSAFHVAAPAPPARGRNGLECAGLRRRVAPSRVFSELQSSAERLVALDPMMKRLKRILVAKRSPSRSDQSSAIPIGLGRGAT